MKTLGIEVRTNTGRIARVESMREEMGALVYTLIDESGKPVWNGNMRGWDESQVTLVIG